MPQSEFLSWIEFYKLWPFDDLHRYHRPAALGAAMQGGKVDELLQWLQPEASTSGYSAAELRSFKAFGIKPPPRVK